MSLRNSFYKNEPEYPNPPGLVDTYMDRFGDGALENISEVFNAIRAKKIGYSGLIISPTDLAAFYEALFTGLLISQDSLEEMIEQGDPYSGFGLGLSTIETKYGTAYGYIAMGSQSMNFAAYFPDAEISIAYSTNIGNFNETSTSGVFTQIWDEITEIVFERRGDMGETNPKKDRLLLRNGKLKKDEST